MNHTCVCHIYTKKKIQVYCCDINKFFSIVLIFYLVAMFNFFFIYWKPSARNWSKNHIVNDDDDDDDGSCLPL